MSPRLEGGCPLLQVEDIDPAYHRWIVEETSQERHRPA